VFCSSAAEVVAVLVVAAGIVAIGLLADGVATAEVVKEESIPAVPRAAVPATMFFIAIRREGLLDICGSGLLSKEITKSYDSAKIKNMPPRLSL
jgi:hypothetical protein